MLIKSCLCLLFFWILAPIVTEAQSITRLTDNPAGNSNPGRFIVYNNNLVFVADNQPWISDGSVANTRRIKNIQIMGNYNIDTCSGLIFLPVADALSGLELWISDGTDAGTALLKDIRPGGGGSLPLVGSTKVFNHKIYFSADDGIHGQELWASDGSATGTTLIKDIAPGTRGSNPGSFNLVNGKLIFTADDSVHGTELWVTDGTDTGTRLVMDLNPAIGSNPQEITPFGNNRILFKANQNTVTAVQPRFWVSDGTPANTYMLNNGCSFPYISAATSSRVYYRDNGRINYINVADTTTYNGITLTYSGAFSYNDTLYIVNNDGELWITDATSGGTYMVKDIFPNWQFGIADPSEFTPFNGKLFFAAQDGTTYKELWSTDGTAVGTIKYPFGGYGITGSMFAMNGALYMSAMFDNTGAELWKFDPNGIPNSTGSVNGEKGICLRPVPAHDFVEIVAPAGIKSVNVYDIMGKSILHGNDTNIVLTGLQPGIYFAEITSENGMKTTLRFIKN